MHVFLLKFAPREGALVRILGMVERRGYVPTRMGLEPCDDGVVELSLEVRSTRPADLLARQLGRLLEVQSVEVLP